MESFEKLETVVYSVGHSRSEAALEGQTPRRIHSLASALPQDESGHPFPCEEHDIQHSPIACAVLAKFVQRVLKAVGDVN